MPKVAKSRRLIVCLLSHHPLVLEEFRVLLSSPKFQLRAQKLDSTVPSELRNLSIPRAVVYVVDAHAPWPATHAVIGGILQRYPSARLLVVAEKFGEADAFPLLRLGVKGLLTYAESRQQLSSAVPMVAGGGFWVGRPILSRFVDWILSSARNRLLSTGVAPQLSRREQEVLGALLENLSNKEIANKLNISERTAKFHVSNLLAKFGVRRRVDLIMLCYQGQPPLTAPVRR